MKKFFIILSAMFCLSIVSCNMNDNRKNNKSGYNSDLVEYENVDGRIIQVTMDSPIITDSPNHSLREQAIDVRYELDGEISEKPFVFSIVIPKDVEAFDFNLEFQKYGSTFAIKWKENRSVENPDGSISVYATVSKVKMFSI